MARELEQHFADIEREQGRPARLEAEVAWLKGVLKHREEVALRALNYEAGGDLEMRVGGESAQIFIATIIQFFHDNGGKNFVTLTVDSHRTSPLGSRHMEVTVRDCTGKKTPAERLGELADACKMARKKMAEYAPIMWADEIDQLDRVIGQEPGSEAKS
jgi:hypothetical protein